MSAWEYDPGDMLTRAMRAKFALADDWQGVVFTRLDDGAGLEVRGAVCPLLSGGRPDWHNRQRGTEYAGTLTEADLDAIRMAYRTAEGESDGK